MKFFQLLGLGLCASIVACSGGGRHRVIGNQCPRVFDPVPMNVPAEQKYSLGEDGNKIPEGDYKYNGADFYYIDGTTDTRVLVREALNRGGVFQTSIACARNVKPDFDGIAVSAIGVSDLTVGPGSKMNFSAKQYGFVVENTRMIPAAVPVEDSQKPDLPSKVYEGEGIEESLVVKIDEANYEIRSRGMVPGGQYFLAVRFVRRDLPPPTANEAETETETEE